MTTTTAAPPPNAKPKMPPPPARPPMGSNGTVMQRADAPVIGRIEAKFQPPRIILNAVEGWGKTTLAAHGPNPLIVMAAGETGYPTLLGAGLVPDVDAAKCESFPEALALIEHLIANDTGHGLIAMDALGGFERLCHDYVCKRDFGGDWGERGFGSYQKGYEVSVNDWLQLLARLDRLRDDRGTVVLWLAHCKIKTFKNPLGPDYDRWVADVHDKTWSATAKWADDVFFGNFFTVVEGGKTGEKARKGKGIGGTERVIYTQRRDAYDAKNRHGMAEVIDVPSDPSQSWATVWNAIRGDKQ